MATNYSLDPALMQQTMEEYYQQNPGVGVGNPYAGIVPGGSAVLGGIGSMYDAAQGGAWGGTDAELQQYLQAQNAGLTPQQMAAFNSYNSPTAADQQAALDAYNARRAAMGATTFQGATGQPTTTPPTTTVGSPGGPAPGGTTPGGPLNPGGSTPGGVVGGVGGLATDPFESSLYIQNDPSLSSITPATVGAANAGAAAQANASLIDRNSVPNVNSQSVLDYNLASYMNPFMQEVRDRTLSDLERSRQMQSITDGDAAMRAGAFGGSRHGVVDALTNERYLDQAARAMAQLNAQAYGQGMNLIQGDIAGSMQAQLANQGAAMGIGSTNAQLGTQVGLANAGAMNNMGQFNANLAQNANLTNAQLAQTASLANAANYLTGQQQMIGQNNNIANWMLQDQGLQNNYAIQSGQLGLNAYNTAGNLLTASGNADWQGYNNASAIVGPNQSTTTTTPSQESPWNNLLGGLALGYGLTRSG